MAISAPRVNIEQQQIGNQPIGVVRVSDGQTTANAIADGADRVAGMLFKRAAEDAEAGATELAQSIEQANVLAIDPLTGAPVALSDMQGMGRIASESYRRVINSRFQQGIEEEIRGQAQILAAQFEDSSDPVGLYTSAMSDYVAAMANNATGSWRAFIEDAGTSYLNRTRTALAVNQLRRSRAAMADAQRRANAEALSSIEAAIAQSNFSDLDGLITAGASSMGGEEAPALSIAQTISESSLAANTDAVDAGILPVGVLDSLPIEQRLAYARGAIRSWGSSLDPANPASEQQILRLQAALGAQDMGSVARIAPELIPYIGFLETNPTLFREFESFSDGVLSDFARLANIEGSETRQAQQAAQNLAIAAFKDQTAFSQAAIARDVRNLSDADVVAYTRQIVQELRRSRQAALANPDENERKAQIERLDAQAAGLQDGLFARLARGQTQTDVDRLRQAFADRDVSRLSQEERILFGQLEFLEFALPGTFDAFDRLFENYRAVARGTEQVVQERAYQELQAVAAIIPNIANMSGPLIGETVDQVIAAIRGIQGLSDGDRRSAERDVYAQAMRANLIDAFRSAETQDDLTSLRGFVSGTVSPNQISEAARNSIEEARRNSGLTGRDGDLSSAANEIMTRMSAQIDARDRYEAEQLRIQQVAGGAGNPSSREDRAAADTAIGNWYFSATGEELPPDFFTSPEYINDANLNELMRFVGTTPGFMPQSMLNAFESIARGNLASRPGYDPATVLAHWSNMRTIDVNGTVFRNSAISALSESDIAVLDLMTDSVPFFGVDGFAEAYRNAQMTMNSPEFQGQISAQLGGATLPNWLSENVPAYNELNSGQRASIQGVAATLLSMSRASPQIGSGEKWLTNRLETHLDRMLPDSNGAVVTYDSNGFASTRSEFTLEAVLGQDTDAFKTYALNNISEFAPTAPAVFSRGSAASEGPIALTARAISTGLGFARPQPYSFLVPFGRSPDGGVTYYVHMFDPETAQTRRVLREDGDNRGAPLIISTAEPAFRSMIEAPDYLSVARGRRALIDRFQTESGSYLGVE